MVYGYGPECLSTCSDQLASCNVGGYNQACQQETSISAGGGYALVIGQAILFIVLTSGVVWLEGKLTHKEGEINNSEWFNTAGRSVKTGLIGSVIVSQWTWAATLLQSSTVAFKYGISGPFWYASGATVQILLFGTLAVELKRKAGNAHTMLEIMRARHGTVGHIVFMIFGFMTNLIVTGMLLLGGAAAINIVTGTSNYAVVFLIPIGVLFYTWHGGLKATFLGHYFNTVTIMVILLCFCFTVYTKDKAGDAAICPNALTTRDYTLLTMSSKGGLVFGIINLVGNFGTVFVDQSYWQSAIATRPEMTVKGFLLGGLVWFSIPFTLATSLGLAAQAMGGLGITAKSAGDGIVPPLAAQRLMGKGGAIAILIQLLMAMSSLVTYDMYKTYLRPNASAKEILMVSRVSVIVLGCLMGVLGVILEVSTLSLGFVYLAMGVFIGSAVAPIALSLLWKNVTCANVVTSALVGLGAALATLYGNIVAIGSSAFICVVWGFLFPNKTFKWEDINANIKVFESGDEKVDVTKQELDRIFYWSLFWGGGLTCVLILFWPLPMYFANYSFSKGFFTFWVVLAVTWAFIGSVIIILAPLWESRGIFMRWFGRKGESDTTKTMSPPPGLPVGTELSVAKSEAAAVA
eukprot:jgi/Chlat1/8289/Chrsp78S07735